MTRPLDPVERALLAQLGSDPDDEQARSVLADHWLTGVDEPRGALVQQQSAGQDGRALLAAHGARWRATAVAHGFAPDQLAFRHGFASNALVLEADDPLLASPDALRLSPRQYVVVRELESTSWRRHFEALGRTVAGPIGRFALKCAHPEVHREIERDAMLLASLAHPHTNRLVDLAIHRACGLAVVTPWAGAPLALGAAPDEARALRLGVPLAGAVSSLAARGIVHRHVEPGAVLVRDDGHVTLAGLGDATAPGVPPPGQNTYGHLAFNFRYFSPEQAFARQPITAATDVFSLAVLLATVALGRHPLRYVETDYAVVQAIRDHAYDVPDDTPLLRLLRTAIVADPAARPTAAELAAGLAAL